MRRNVAWKAAILLACIAVSATAAEPTAQRVPAVSAHPDDPLLQQLFGEVRARGGEPLNMHRAIGNAPKMLQAWNQTAYAIRFGAEVPRLYRELAILRTTQLGDGMYEFNLHGPMAQSCGLSAAQLAALPDWRNSTLFDDKERAVLAYVEGMTQNSGPDDAAAAAMQKNFAPKEIVEITVTAAFYAASSRVTKALAVPLEAPAAANGTSYGKC